MDDQTGHFYEFGDEEIKETYRELLEQVDGSMTEVDNLPDPACPHCQGTGRRKTYYQNGKRFRPCECTNKGSNKARRLLEEKGKK